MTLFFFWLVDSQTFCSGTASMSCAKFCYVWVENIGRNASSNLGMGITERFPSRWQPEERFLSIRSQSAEGHVCKLLQAGLNRELDYMCSAEEWFISWQYSNDTRISKVFPMFGRRSQGDPYLYITLKKSAVFWKFQNFGPPYRSIWWLWGKKSRTESTDEIFRSWCGMKSKKLNFACWRARENLREW